MREKLYLIKIRIFSHCHKTRKLVLRHLRWFVFDLHGIFMTGELLLRQSNIGSFYQKSGEFWWCDDGPINVIDFDDGIFVVIEFSTVISFYVWSNFQRWSCYWCTMIHSMGGVKKWQSISTHFVFWGESATCILSFLSLFLASLHGNSSSRFYLLSR